MVQVLLQLIISLDLVFGGSILQIIKEPFESIQLCAIDTRFLLDLLRHGFQAISEELFLVVVYLILDHQRV